MCSPDTIAYRIADKIRENVMSCRSPVLLMVGLILYMKGVVFTVWTL